MSRHHFGAELGYRPLQPSNLVGRQQHAALVGQVAEQVEHVVNCVHVQLAAVEHEQVLGVRLLAGPELTAPACKLHCEPIVSRPLHGLQVDRRIWHRICLAQAVAFAGFRALVGVH